MFWFYKGKSVPSISNKYYVSKKKKKKKKFYALYTMCAKRRPSLFAGYNNVEQSMENSTGPVHDLLWSASDEMENFTIAHVGVDNCSNRKVRSVCAGCSVDIQGSEESPSEKKRM